MEVDMRFYPQSKKGFIFNEDVAEQLGLLEEYKLYQEDLIMILNEAFNEKKMEPEIQNNGVKGGYVQGLQGFDWDVNIFFLMIGLLNNAQTSGISLSTLWKRWILKL